MRKLLFLDRDGTLIAEPPDRQVDRLDKLKLLPGVVHALKRLRDAGYELVMVSNQDGLGTDLYPRVDYETVQVFLRELFAGQGIRFEAERICPHTAAEACECRSAAAALPHGHLAGWQSSEA